MGKINFDCLFSELVITFSRSSGKGGQHVNKVATKAELAFNVSQSVCLNEEHKKLVAEKLANKINEDGLLKLQSSESRSQLSNKENVIKKFKTLIEK